jgi:hypothetical protein
MDVINDMLKDEYEYVSSGDQMLNHVEIGTTEMGFDTMRKRVILT